MMRERKSGILLHPTSLPGKYGIGTLGHEAYDFVDFLADSGQQLWQILPLNHTGDGNCPYASISAFAGNPLLIDLEKLADEGLLSTDDFESGSRFNIHAVNYDKIRNHKITVLRKAFESFRSSYPSKEKEDYHMFCRNEECWLDDLCIFIELRKYFSGRSWGEWDDDIRKRKKPALEKYYRLLYDGIEFQKFMQYIFFRQWHELKKYANSKKIKVIGDIPIFVSYESADVWAHPSIFMLDRKMLPKEVAGVPPDFFSKTGQLWGNPLYDWKTMKQQGYKWWLERFRKMFEVTDIVRIDHFRGFEKFWAIPYGDKTAENGKWRSGPSSEFFDVLEKTFGELPLIAEDLGYITPAVVRLRNQFGLAGMKVLHFLFNKNDLENGRHLSFPLNSVVYTGTHDNDTTMGWYRSLSSEEKAIVKKYLKYNEKNIVWDMIAHACASASKYAVIPMQDILSLGSISRMNMPGTNEGDWEWRYTEDQITSEIVKQLLLLIKRYDR